jgi:RNA polymerase sigma factor (TIGR02999 family)
MNQEQQHDLSVLLEEARSGSKEATDRLLRAVYWDFHRIAEALMRAERPSNTLQPSALLNEAVIRLINGAAFERAPNRRYLFAAAAQAMRRALVEHARKRRRVSRMKRVPMDDVLTYFDEQNLDVIALNEAIDRLSAVHERQGTVVVLRFFAGLPTAEVAELLGVSIGTVEGDWRFARAWLRSQL